MHIFGWFFCLFFFLPFWLDFVCVYVKGHFHRIFSYFSLYAMVKVSYTCICAWLDETELNFKLVDVAFHI